MKLTARLSPRLSDPCCTRPPRRKRLPAATCFSATIEGVEKNTMESRMAFSTSAAATASTASEPPIIVNRRCLRVMVFLCASATSPIKPEIFQALIELAQALRIPRDGLTGIGDGARRLVAVAHHHIGPHQPQPSLDIVAILLQPRRKTIDHATDHRAAVGLVHFLGRGHRAVRQGWRWRTADPHQCRLNQPPPWRVRR